MMCSFYLFSVVLVLAMGQCKVNGQSDCPSSCTCATLSRNLTIKCSSSASQPITLPSPFTSPSLFSVSYLIASNSFLTIIPTSSNNFCQYRLLYLDMSTNLISMISATTFTCQGFLTTLLLSNNQISYIAPNSFDSLTNLVTLDLSYNKISYLPTYLFVNTTNNLQYLYLQNNQLTSLDPWFFYMKQIRYISLAANQITMLTNNVNFSAGPNGVQVPAFAWAVLIDLTHNQITRFDDSVLQMYSVCSQLAYTFFIQFLYNMTLTDNPLQCSCGDSFNMISWSKVGISNYQANPTGNNGLNPSMRVFQNSICQAGSFLGKSALNFYDSGCSLTSGSNYDCSYGSTAQTSTRTSTTTVSVNAEAVIGVPEYELKVSGPSDLFYAGYVSGIVIAFVGAVILFCLLMYLICPAEILACLFRVFPCFYSFCPCKSSHRREKEYDVFVSFNPNNEKWVHKHLLPFIKKHELLETYALHYNDENKKRYSDYVESAMSRSSIILIVLSDDYLINEWQDQRLHDLVRILVTRERVRLICIQLHDVSDEEVEEYFREKAQISHFVALEDDEFMFWPKLYYYLYMNEKKNLKKRILPYTKNYKPRPDDEIEFQKYNINRPIVHLDGKADPFSVNKPNVQTKTKAIASQSQLEELTGSKKKMSTSRVKLLNDDLLNDDQYATSIRDDKNKKDTINIDYSSSNNNSARSLQVLAKSNVDKKEDDDVRNGVVIRNYSIHGINMNSARSKAFQEKTTTELETERSISLKKQTGEVIIDMKQVSKPEPVTIQENVDVYQAGYHSILYNAESTQSNQKVDLVIYKPELSQQQPNKSKLYYNDLNAIKSGPVNTKSYKFQQKPDPIDQFGTEDSF